jgi:hypothetical protein
MKSSLGGLSFIKNLFNKNSINNKIEKELV